MFVCVDGQGICVFSDFSVVGMGLVLGAGCSGPEGASFLG